MMSLNQCDSCVHEKVCKVLDYLRRADVKAMITSCRDHYQLAPTLFDLDKRGTKPRDFSSDSLAELSRKIHDAVDKELGPKKPPRLPMELITAIPVAAAVPVRNWAGIVQNSGVQAKMPAAPMHRQTIVATVPSTNIAAISEIDAISTATFRCHLLS